MSIATGSPVLNKKQLRCRSASEVPRLQSYFAPIGALTTIKIESTFPRDISHQGIALVTPITFLSV